MSLTSYILNCMKQETESIPKLIPNYLKMYFHIELNYFFQDPFAIVNFRYNV